MPGAGCRTGPVPSDCSGGPAARAGVLCARTRRRLTMLAAKKVIMKSTPSPFVQAPTKAASGITGFDEIPGGGLPRGRTTLLIGGPGSGKTILALQFLVHGAGNCREPGIFVAFEETSARIAANAEAFGWKLAALRRRTLFFLGAPSKRALVHYR